MLWKPYSEAKMKTKCLRKFQKGEAEDKRLRLFIKCAHIYIYIYIYKGDLGKMLMGTNGRQKNWWE
jgi:hypothetical protein